jgi:hypothetical protein
VPSLGATSFIMDEQQILNLPQGADAPFNQVLLRAPGVAEDSAANGDLHVRGEHANLQYRINDVLLPEGITGFGLELDPRFVKQHAAHHRLAARAVRLPHGGHRRHPDEDRRASTRAAKSPSTGELRHGAPEFRARRLREGT